MAKYNETILTPNDNELTITRVFDAPRELLWKAFTTKESLTQWWGPKGWTLPVCEIDFRVGGEWFYCMAGPNGEQSCGVAVFKEISAPERFVNTDSFADDKGNVNESMPTTTITNEFVDLGNGQSKLVSHARYDSAEQLKMVLEMGMGEGIRQTWDRLDDLVATA